EAAPPAGEAAPPAGEAAPPAAQTAFACSRRNRRASGSVTRNALIQRASGWASTNIALAASVSGTARIAPSGPATSVHRVRDRNETTGLSPTASPVTFGWIIVWMVKFS